MSIDLAFNIDQRDLETSMKGMIDQVNRSLGSTVDIADDLTASLADAVKPLEQLVSHADKLRSYFKDIKDATDSIRQNVASTRLQAGPTSSGGISGPTAGAFGGGFLGSLLGGGGLLSGLGSIASLGLGAFGIAGATTWDALTSRFGTPGGVTRQGGLLGMARHLMSGDSLSQVGAQTSVDDMARIVGGASGLMRSIGQGPLQMVGMTIGGAQGAQAGREIASQFGGGTISRTIGGALGSAVMQGMVPQYIQEAMSRYPQFLQTSASMAQVGLYGGDVRTMRRMRAARFGYSPEEQGQAFGALFQGFGGGDLTADTQRTAMAYSRAYGVDMGAIGQAMGGLINVGGGGQGASAEQRETIMARVMADAVSEGFGRRLPEFANAVGTGLNTAMSGPSVVGQDAMQNLIQSTSRLTGRVMSAQGVGLAGAGRFMAPLQQAPGRFLEGMMGGGGDPYQMAMMWSTNRDRFGNDPLALMDALAEAQANPFSENALNMQRGSLEEIMRSGGSEYSQVLAMRQLMPDISYQGARQVIGRAREEYAETGSLEGLDMLEAFTGVEQTQMDEGESTRETMREIQRSGEAIMQEQLGAMRNSAQFAEAQFGISAAMAADAQVFHTSQMAFQRAQVSIMQAIGVSTSIGALGSMFGPEQARALQTGTTGERVQRFLTSVLSQVDPETAQNIFRVPRESEQQEEEEGATPVSVGTRRVGSAARGVVNTVRNAATGSNLLRRGAQLVQGVLDPSNDSAREARRGTRHTAGRGGN